MTPGAKLGPYEILAPIGAGGMGEVYRARDTKLKRDVALKVLPEAFARDPERMARFQREAEVLASLNHPNIAAIYGVEDRALVMELVEGDSPKGPMAFDEAWHIASQIVAALEYAHDKGIVHRDLKPANVKVTPDGVVKLLDFGLAKAFTAQPAGSADPENSPTLTIGATQVGVILGTAAYMSPEQAKGKSVDKRADIWAFGVMLYELLTGQRLFTGEDVSETLAQVLTKVPEFEPVPAKVRRLLRECLEKDPKRRLRDIGDAQRLLGEESAVTAPSRSRLGMIAGAMAVVLAVALGAIAWVHFRELPPEAAAVRFQIPLPEKTYLPTLERALAMSPDGHSLAFTAVGEDGRPRLWIRSLDSLDARSLPGTDGVRGIPFWSPDSRFVAFGLQGKLMKIAVSGGPPQALCDAARFGGGTWNRDGTIVFGVNGGAGLFRVHQSGGSATRITTLGAGTNSLPEFLPDGRHFIYRSVLQENSGSYLATLDGKEKKRLVDVGPAHYAPPSAGGKPGHLLFLRGSTLMAQPLDPKSFDLDGEAFPLGAEQVGVFSVSAGGALAYLAGPAQIAARPVWFDRKGTPLGTLGPPGRYSGLALSPDGKRAAVDLTVAESRDIWVMDAATGVSSKLTFGGSAYAPVWSPDGNRLAFTYNRAGMYNVYRKDSRGAGNEEALLNTGSSGARHPGDWSADGKFLLYDEDNPNTGSDLWFLPLDPAGTRGDPKPQLYIQTQFNEDHAQFSPGPADSPRWVAYSSTNESGQREVYVQSFPPGAGKFQVSVGGGGEPRWRRDGKELFYISADSKLMAVDVKTTPNFEHGNPKSLFQTRIFGGVNLAFPGYDVAPDGQRFLIVTEDPAEQAPPAPITVVLNWQAGLKK